MWSKISAQYRTAIGISSPTTGAGRITCDGRGTVTRKAARPVTPGVRLTAVTDRIMHAAGANVTTSGGRSTVTRSVVGLNGRVAVKLSPAATTQCTSGVCAVLTTVAGFGTETRSRAARCADPRAVMRELAGRLIAYSLRTPEAGALRIIGAGWSTGHRTRARALLAGFTEASAA